MVARVTAVLGWFLCLGLVQVKGSYGPGDMNKTIQNLLDHYRIPLSQRYDGQPVFPEELLSGNLQADMVYMSAVLQTYDQMLDQMLKQLPVATPTSGENDAATTDVRKQLKTIQQKISDLRKQHYRKPEELLKNIQNLRQVQLTSPVVQSKALWELVKLYQKASSLPNQLQRRRRRRQTQVKGHRRARRHSGSS